MTPPKASAASLHRTAQEFLLQQVLETLKEIASNMDKLNAQVRVLENDANKAERLNKMEGDLRQIKTYGSLVFLIPTALALYNFFHR